MKAGLPNLDFGNQEFCEKPTSLPGYCYLPLSVIFVTFEENWNLASPKCLPLSHIMLLIRHAPNPNRFDLMSLGIGV
jgi:hypothetical protein